MRISILSPDLSINCLGRAHLLAGILRRRYEVEIVGPAFGGAVWPPVADDGRMTYRCVDFRGRLRPFRRLPELFREITGDVLYASKPFLTSYGVALVKSRLRHRPLVLDIDDWEIGSIREHYRNLSAAGRLRYLAGSTLLPYKMGSYWNIGLHEKLVPRADEITVSNRFLQKRYGGELVWHARDTDAFDPGRVGGDAARERMGIDESRKVVIFLGTPRPPKGLEDAIEAVRMLGGRGAMLIIAGMGRDGYSLELEEKGRRALGAAFRSFGMLPFGSLPEFLAMADAVVIPQRSNPATVGQLPAKVFDAMAMARPIVATGVSDLPEILDGCGWIVAPGSPRELSSAIGYIFDNPADAAERGRRARRKCIEKYSWDAMEKVLVDIFKKYE